MSPNQLPLTTSSIIRVLCVDDSGFVADTLRRYLSPDRGFEWVGRLHSSLGLAEEVGRCGPDVVVLDADMAGPDVFEATDDLARRFPSAHVVMLSGHVGPELIDRAIDAGAWGFVSKNDDAESIIGAVRGAAAGAFVLRGEAERRYGRGQSDDHQARQRGPGGTNGSRRRKST